MRKFIDSRGDRMESARTGTHGLERILRKRGRPPLIATSEEAEAYAQSQPWYRRIVHKGCNARLWFWWVRPEEAR